MISEADLLGSWRLAGAAAWSDDAVVDPPPLGAKPEGVIHYLPDQRVAVVIAHDGRRPISNGDRRNGAQAEMAAAFTSFDAYAGDWMITGEHEVTHQLDLCSFENDRQAAYVRQVSWNGPNLVLATPRVATPRGMRHMTLEWRRFER